VTSTAPPPPSRSGGGGHGGGCARWCLGVGGGAGGEGPGRCGSSVAPPSPTGVNGCMVAAHDGARVV
jgi:hypothetical protein